MTQAASGTPEDGPDQPWWTGSSTPAGSGTEPTTGPPPSASYGTYEGQTGYGGYGSGPGGAQPPIGPPGGRGPGHLRTSAILLIAVVALLAGGAGAAIGVHIGRDQKPATNSRATISPAISASAAGGQTSLEAVASAVSPAVVLVSETSGDLLGTGSGVVLDAAKGYILTNNHVVSAFATGGGTLTVTTMTGRTVKATVVGRDPTADIAVIQVSLDGLTQVRTGDSSTVAVGETVVAFGAPLGLQGTVTSGIVSALNRPVSTQDTATGDATATQATIDAIQTDAAINPGNSGGPLVDLSGQVIGINSAIASVAGASGQGQSTESGNIGVGFAIPINEALYTADQLIATGHAVHAIIGVSLDAQADGTTSAGATVKAVTAGGPAAKAGIQPGDVIVAIDGAAIPDPDSAIVAVRAGHKPGDTIKIVVSRGGQQRTVSVVLGASAPS